MSFWLRPLPWAAKNLLTILTPVLATVLVVSSAVSPALAQTADMSNTGAGAALSPTELSGSAGLGSSVYCDMHREMLSQSNSQMLPGSTIATASVNSDSSAKNEADTENKTDTVSDASTSASSNSLTQSTSQSSSQSSSQPTSQSLSKQDSLIPVSPAASNSESQLDPIVLAQSIPTDTMNETQQVDLVPAALPRRTPAFGRYNDFQQRALYHLPAKMFFSSVIENSLRLETNVFQTSPKESSDMIYRILPNTTLGYALTKSTRVSANYFFLRDQYTDFSPLLNRNFHSLGFQITQALPVKGKTGVMVGFMGRGLWATLDKFPGSFFNDYLPSITVTRPLGDKGRAMVYASVIGQLRFREMCARFQEGDIFYTLGHIYRRGGWTLANDFTLVSNFGSQKIRQGPDTQIIIMGQELSRQISRKYPWLQTFLRTQQIYNMGAGNVPFIPGVTGGGGVYPGFAGVNCRVFGGLRMTLNKDPIWVPKLKGM